MVYGTHVLAGTLTGLFVLSVRNSVLVIPQIVAMVEKSSGFINTLDVPGEFPGLRIPLYRGSISSM